MDGDNIRVNGNAMSWGSIVIKIDGERLKGFTMISYADKRERTKGYGLGVHHAPGRRSRGKYTVEPVKLRGYKSNMQALRNYLANANGSSSFGDYEFEVLVQATEEDETPLTVELQRCVYVGRTASHEENPDLLQEEVELDCMAIVENGLTLFDGSEGAP